MLYIPAQLALILLAVSLMTIIVHEAAHFATARWVGMRISHVSIGIFPMWSRRWYGIEWKLGILPIRGAVQIHGENRACETLSAEELEGAMHYVPPRSQLIVAAAGLAANAMLLLAAIVWVVAETTLSAGQGLNDLVAWIKGINQLFVAARTHDFDLGESAEAAIMAHWSGARLPSAIALGGIANFLALVVNLPPTPLRDGWHIERAWKEMNGAPPLSQQEWDTKKSSVKSAERVVSQGFLGGLK
jgi:membrane-associated protease RseP (regulator of RpoE activity)